MRIIITAAAVAVVSLAIAGQASAASGVHYCSTTPTGWRISAGTNTSCSFARSVYSATRRYQARHGRIDVGDAFKLRVRSKTTGRTYTMYMTAGETRHRFIVAGEGGRGAYVQFTHRQ